MPPKRMTANPVKPARYRPGKPVAEEPSSSDGGEESGDDEEQAVQGQPQAAAPVPKASSFPKNATKLSANLQNVDLNARRREGAAQESARLEAERAARAAAEAGFETESEEEEEGSGEEGSESEDDSSEEEESSSEDEAAARRKKMLRPVFVRKDQRKVSATANAGGGGEKTEEEKWAEETARRKAKTDALVQEQLQKNAAARAAGKKFWDDEDEAALGDEVDDRDGLAPEAEFAAWKLRELTRVKREREAIEAAEKERDEVERRRNLTAEEREAEDRAFIEQQKEDRAQKGSMATMQKYFHKGAFFQDDLAEAGLDRRDIMGSRFVDDVRNKDALPEYMQIRDMTKLGRKGRSKYKDMRSEDTGRWGDFGDRRGKGAGGDFRGVDDRFRPDNDREGGGPGATGANAKPVGERKRYGEERDDREGKRPRITD